MSEFYCVDCRNTGLRWYTSIHDPDDVEKGICDCPAGDFKEDTDVPRLA
jgi:hypothetical protein